MHKKHPPPVVCCLAPERPNPSRRAMDVNDCCITTRLHGTDGRVPSGEQNVETYSLPAKFPSIERRAGRYITAPLVAAFTKQGAFCLFHESPLAKRHAPASQQIPSPPSLKEVSIAGTAGLDTLFLLHGRSGPLQIHPATRQRPADSGQVSSRLR